MLSRRQYEREKLAKERRALLVEEGMRKARAADLEHRERRALLIEEGVHRALARITRETKSRKSLSDEDKQIIGRRSNWYCVYCGVSCRRGRRSFDHFAPRSKGGASTIDNFVLSCLSCNSRKKDRGLEHMRHRMALRALQWPEMSAEVVAWAGKQGASVETYYSWKFWFERSDCKYASSTREIIAKALAVQSEPCGTGTSEIKTCNDLI